MDFSKGEVRSTPSPGSDFPKEVPGQHVGEEEGPLHCCPQPKSPNHPPQRSRSSGHGATWHGDESISINLFLLVVGHSQAVAMLNGSRTMPELRVLPADFQLIPQWSLPRPACLQWGSAQGESMKWASSHSAELCLVSLQCHVQLRT